jgi:hypothetical protein
VPVRFFPLDRLRALAVVAMVQGHTFSALLAEDALPATAMQVHATLHGLTAPAFLLGAGLSFGVATYPQYARHARPGRALWLRLRRYLGVALLGYLLQLPGASLLTALQLHGEQLAPIFRVGPLQLIALCLTVCQLAALVLRSARAHAAGACALGLGLMALSPWVWSAQLGARAGPLLGPWLDGARGSLFPICPWASFAFFGVALARLLPHAGPAELASPGSAEAVRPAPGGAWLVSGLVLALLAYLLFRLGVQLSEPKWFWHASPLYVAFRLGLVMALLGLLHARRAGLDPGACASLCTADARADRAEQAAAAGWSELLARHSLVAYVAHLLLLYGTPFTPSLVHHLGLRLAVHEASACFVAIMAATLLATQAWASIAKQGALASGWVRAALSALGLLMLAR